MSGVSRVAVVGEWGARHLGPLGQEGGKVRTRTPRSPGVRSSMGLGTPDAWVPWRVRAVCPGAVRMPGFPGAGARTPGFPGVMGNKEPVTPDARAPWGGWCQQGTGDTGCCIL